MVVYQILPIFANEQTNQTNGQRKSCYHFVVVILADVIANISSFFLMSNKRTNKIQKIKIMAKEKITRDRLRGMKNGETISVECNDAYDMDSQRNTAYDMQKKENCRFACRSIGLTLSVTRYDDND